MKNKKWTLEVRDGSVNSKLVDEGFLSMLFDQEHMDKIEEAIQTQEFYQDWMYIIRPVSA